VLPGVARPLDHDWNFAHAFVAPPPRALEAVEDLVVAVRCDRDAQRERAHLLGARRHGARPQGGVALPQARQRQERDVAAALGAVLPGGHG
jgi:hypothetical protein